MPICPTARAASLLLACTLPLAALAASPVCEVHSGAQRMPVLELYTSEGCSSCPPADQWLSGLKGQPVVAQAFHVAYWDTIGWTDRFAQPQFGARQREQAALQHQRSVYTPQWLRDGHDWQGAPPAGSAAATVLAGTSGPAKAHIHLLRLAQGDRFEAQVEPMDAQAAWTAYWTVTEDGHSSKVKAGENAGAFLQHDFVVRQYTPLGRYQGPQRLQFVARAADPAHARRVNLVVSDARSAEPLQAASLSCL